MSSCRYTGTWQDFSGYGQANRTDIAALFLAGVDIETELVVQVPERTRFGWMGDLCKELEGRNTFYKIKIIHLTPDMYPRYMEAGKYHIGRLMWETNHLPQEWVTPCNRMQEIWTASEAQAQMIRDSGVTIPVKAFPQAIDLIPSTKPLSPFTIPNWNGFLFYSVFQWIERKNPKALLTTYWKTFSGNQNVALLLKTYRVTYQEDEFNKIKDDIRVWKEELKLSHYPKVFLVKQLLSTEQLFRLHQTGDCYISTSRGEGWGIPAVEASSLGKPIITIDKTGLSDYLPADSYYPCKTYSTKVVPVHWIPWYTADQNWLEIVQEDLGKQMLAVYNNRDQAKKTGLKAQKFVKEELNFWKVGQMMKDRLIEIESFI